MEWIIEINSDYYHDVAVDFRGIGASILGAVQI